MKYRLMPGKCLSLVFISTLLVSCVNTPGIPEDHFYRLPDIETVHSAKLNGIESIGVAQIESSGLYRERSILFITEMNPLELKPYHYRYWTYPPAELIQQHLIYYLKKTFPDKKILRFSTGDSVDAVIRGRIIRFERIVNNDTAKVLVSLELGFQSNRQEYVFITQQEYRHQSEAEKNEINKSIEQFGAALIQNYQAFLSDIQAKQMLGKQVSQP